MGIEGWTLAAWVGAAVVMLVLLKVWLGRICELSCEDLGCVRRDVCEGGQS